MLCVVLLCAGLLFVQRDIPLLNQQGTPWSHRWPWIPSDIFGAPGRGLAYANLKVCVALIFMTSLIFDGAINDGARGEVEAKRGPPPRHFVTL